MKKYQNLETSSSTQALKKKYNKAKKKAVGSNYFKLNVTQPNKKYFSASSKQKLCIYMNLIVVYVDYCDLL